MDDVESVGAATALRAYLHRAVCHVMGGEAQGVPLELVGELFATLNIELPAAQLTRLKTLRQPDKGRRECMHLARSFGRASRMRQWQGLESSPDRFSLNDLHWCVLELLRDATHAHAAHTPEHHTSLLRRLRATP